MYKRKKIEAYYEKVWNFLSEYLLIVVLWQVVRKEVICQKKVDTPGLFIEVWPSLEGILKSLFQKRLILETLFGKTMRELKWITIFTPYSVRISLIIANILIFKYNLSNIFDNIIPLFNEIHVNAHVRTYELYSYLPSFGHNDFFFSIQSKRNRYS